MQKLRQLTTITILTMALRSNELVAVVVVVVAVVVVLLLRQ
jgi:hypothetical protein